MKKNKSKAKAKLRKPVAKKAKVKSTGKDQKLAAKALKKNKMIDKPLKTKEKQSKPIQATVVVAQQKPIDDPKEEIILTNAEGKRYCKVSDCDEIEVIDSYCRLHYIMYWKRNKTKAKILEGGKLDKYIEELTHRYPDKYLEMLKKDLASEKDFNGIIAEMDAEDASDESDSEEDDNRFIEEVRGSVGGSTPDDDESF